MKISIFGAAGVVGSTTAYTIAAQGLADEIVMLDTRQNVLGNHAMDINTAAENRHNTVVRAGSYQDIAGSDVVIIAAGIHFSGSALLKDKLSANVPIMRDIALNITKYCPEAVVITASNPVDLLSYAVFLASGLKREKFIGYNMNDSLRFRSAIAKALGIKPTQVEAIVGGIHPEAQVMFFSSVKVDGKPFTGDDDFKRRTREEAQNYLKILDGWQAGRTAGWTTAYGLAVMVKAIAQDARQAMPCSVIVDGEYGNRDISIGLPAVIGRKGVLEIPKWQLLADEKTELDRVAGILKTNCGLVREMVG